MRLTIGMMFTVLFGLLARPNPAEDEPGVRLGPRGGGAGAGPRRVDVTGESYHGVLLPEEGVVVPVELIQTLVNALLLLVVAFVGGTLGLRRFEAVERSVAELRAEVKADIAGLRTDVGRDIAELRAELKADIAELRGEQAGMRSDLTVVALAVGARRAEG